MSCGIFALRVCSSVADTRTAMGVLRALNALWHGLKNIGSSALYIPLCYYTAIVVERCAAAMDVGGQRLPTPVCITS